jgi:hypothetical protein
MEAGIGNLRADALRAKLELNWIAAATLTYDLENSILTDGEKRATSRHWQEVTHEGDLLAFVLDLIRRQQKESVSHGTRKSKLRI